MKGMVAVIQARMDSTRLPRKVLMKLGDRPVLAHVVQGVQRARMVDRVVVAVPSTDADGPLGVWCRKLGVECVWGPEDDVLGRYALAARMTMADHIVRITADCPCVDPAVVDRVVRAHLEAAWDYTSNTMRRTYPRGFDVEVFGIEALIQADLEAREPFEREHVTPFIYQNPERFRIRSVRAPGWCGHPSWRVCLDTQEDYEMLKRLWDLCRERDGSFPGAAAIAQCLESHPELLDCNGHVLQKDLPGQPDLIRECV